MFVHAKKYFAPAFLVVCLVCLLTGLFLFPIQASAQTGVPDTFGIQTFGQSSQLETSQDLRVIIGRIVQIFLGLLGIIAIGIVLFGGYLYMTSGGNDDQVTRARKMLINGVIGLVIILASFAITQFVLTRLEQALDLTGGAAFTPQCQQWRLANDPRYWIQCQGAGSGVDCSQNPSWCCSGSNFVVQSITPRTDATNMNNPTIRVIFSRPFQGAAGQAVTVWRNNADVTSEFIFSFVDAQNTVLEGIYGGRALCVGPETDCVALGTYRVVVNPDLRDQFGSPLTVNAGCGVFPLEAMFVVNEPIIRDTTPPSEPQVILIDSAAGIDQPLMRGQSHTISLRVADNTGAGYLHLDVHDMANNQPITSVYDGPAISRGSDASNTPYAFSYPLFLPNSLPALTRYEILAQAFDIDGNSRTATTSFYLVGEHCGNGVQDGDETSVDAGGSCPLASGSCTANYQCLSQLCVSGQCVGSPLITAVDPWDGAGGNYVTIAGRFFGNQPGQVAFARDTNGDGAIDTQDTWTDVTPLSCGGLPSWSDTAIVVAVPSDDTAFPINSTSSIRVVHVNDSAATPLRDTTTDRRGVQGLFTKNTVNRPGLCRVATTRNNAAVALPGDEVLASGRGFGTTQQQSRLLFGGIQASSIRSWDTDRVVGNIPNNLRPGLVGVHLVFNDGSGDRVSNGVPFTILATGQNVVPTIEAVDPTSTTAGSLVTLYGQRFGTRLGQVFASPKREQCLTTSATCQAVPTSFAQCGNSWQDEQVIMQLPSGILGAYYLTLVNAAGYGSDGSDLILVVPGASRPGICGLSPSTGPAPLPAGQQLTLSGVNFGAGPTVYFWRRGAVATNFSTWLAASGNQIVASDTQIQTPIPVGSDGFSMETGDNPIRVVAGGEQSNSVRYRVNDCRSTVITTPGFQCCTDGPDAGFLRPDAYVCTGETRTAGYVWRFTTGRIPQIPYVIEQCDPAQPAVQPSPSPSSQWNQPACLNARIGLLFSTGMNSSSVQNGVRILTCGNGTNADCRSGTDVTNQFRIQYQFQSVMIDRTNPSAVLDTNTWYHVELGIGIQSQEVRPILGQSVIHNEPLQATKPCGTGTAYCFEFKTGGPNSACQPVTAYLNPHSLVTHFLGVIQDPRYALDLNDPLNPRNPLYYYVTGGGAQACSLLNVDGLGWQWRTTNQTLATAVPVVDAWHTDTQGKVTALQDSSGRIVDIIAEVPARTLTATSSLVIDLGDPTTTAWWPSCVESCANAQIGVRFNRYMNTSTYTGGITVERCANALCTQIAGGVAVTDVSRDELIYRVSPQAPLATNTWYLVTVHPTIRALSNLQGGLGNPIAQFQWKFRTKETDGLCVIDSVRLTPDPFTATRIGQKTQYRAIPHSVPDQCSRFGQELNAWGYGWNWSTQDPQVATVTNFQSIAVPRQFCSLSCLPSGSDVARGRTLLPLCGDGVRQANEDCDLSMRGVRSSDGSTVFDERIGTTCSLSCLRTGTIGSSCGNGIIQEQFGEECDPSSDRSNPAWRFCNPDCTNTGSENDPVTATLPGVPYCGDREIEAGEECEPLLSPATCTGRCLRQGNQTVAQAWCTANAASVFGNTTVGRSNACLGAIGVCGNNQLEDGEECEVIQGDPIVGGTGVIMIPGTAQVPVEDTRVCNKFCLLENICNEVAIPAPFRCVRDQAGCQNDCTLAGSSLNYQASSLCGDAILGVGESPLCEYRSGEYDPTVRLGADPAQIVTAVGLGAVSASGTQSTRIDATALSTRLSSTQIQPLTAAEQVTGSGSYQLQCGFTEYDRSRINTTSAPVPLYNDCPANVTSAGDPTMADNAEGVGYNSCCYLRTTRVAEYPVDGSGLAGQSGVCRNTYIEVTFDGDIDRATVAGHVSLVRGYPGAACPNTGETDVTQLIGGTLAYAGGATSGGWWQRLWAGAARFFAELFTSAAQASNYRNPQVTTWCSGGIDASPEVRYVLDTNGRVVSTTVALYLKSMLATNTTYAVIMTGGADGIRDRRGVPIRPPLASSAASLIDDSFIFKTGDQVCRLERVRVTPASHLFSTPNTSTQFAVEAIATGARPIVSVPGFYEWDWAWGPEGQPVFAIPALNASTSTPTTTIASRNVEGQLQAFANARVTVDQGGQRGRVFSGSTRLTAQFCERPWPALSVFPFEDGVAFGATVNNDGVDPAGAFDGSAMRSVNLGAAVIRGEYFNFRMSYCADAGRSGTTTDDLPYLRPVIFGDLVNPGSCGAGGVACVNDSQCVGTGNSCQGLTIARTGRLPDDSLKKFVFFTDNNDDIIGIQIFKNPRRASARDWYTDVFPISGAALQPVTVDGYDGVRDQNNVYINALNRESDGQVYNRIYLFSINADAAPNTRRVFETLLKSLEFNINISDFGFCSIGNGSDTQAGTRGLRDIDIPETNPSVSCATDFDCVDVVGSARLCANAKTKFRRDWERLHDVRDMQTAVATYRQQNGFYPPLFSGTYLPGKTASRWPSWNQTLSTLLRTQLPTDPINEWTQCGGNDVQTCWDPVSATFVCPLFSSVYAYTYATSSADYQLHIPLEYFRASEQVIQEFVDPAHLTTNPFCTPGTTSSPFGETCGDGVVNVGAGEECDPPGRSMVGTTGGIVSSLPGQCVYADRRVAACTVDVDCPVTDFRGGTAAPGGGLAPGGTVPIPGTPGVPQSFTVSYADGTSVCQYKNQLMVDTALGNVGTRSAFIPVTTCSVDADCSDILQRDIIPGQHTWLAFDPSAQLYAKTILATANPTDFSCASLSSATGYRGGDIATCGGVQSNVLVGQACPIVNGVQEQATAVCTTQCRFAYGSCQAPSRCGNGFVEANETCDDGPLNGAYGHCSDGQVGSPPACQGPHPQYCGNGFLERSPGGRSLEYCERVQFTNHGFCRDARGQTFADLGMRWIPMASGVQGTDQIEDVFALDEKRAWAVGGSGLILQTTDGGNQWQKITGIPAAEYLSAVHFVNDRVGFAAGDGARGGTIASTTDGGATWRFLTTTSQTSNIQLRDLSFSDEQTGWVVGYPGRAAHTTDMGRTWSWQILAVAEDLSGVQFITKDRGWIVGKTTAGYGTVHRTTNEGVSWTTVFLPDPTAYLQQHQQSDPSNNGEDYILNDVQFVNPNVGWVVGARGSIYKTTDGGVTWFAQAIPNVQTNLTDVIFMDVDNGWVVGDVGLTAKTTDGGQNWIVLPPAPNSRDLKAISFPTSRAGFVVGRNGTVLKTGIIFCATDTVCNPTGVATTDSCIARDNTAYHPDQAQTCANDCQSPGGYCGDGIPQFQYEQCDDHNLIDTDQCTNTCLERDFAVGSGGPASAPPGCGNGVTDTGEACDLGAANNGVQCQLQYGRSCTYCSGDCRQVLTRDPTDFCGNGRVDQTGTNVRGQAQYETCDIRSDGVVVSTQANVPNICPDKGQYQCSSQCSVLTPNCVTCGVRLTVDGGSPPNIAVLNPMVGIYSLGGGVVQWAQGQVAHLYGKTGILDNRTGQPLLQSLAPVVPYLHPVTNQPTTMGGSPLAGAVASTYPNFRQTHHVFVDQDGNQHQTQAIEANVQCSTATTSEYAIDFSNPVPAQDINRSPATVLTNDSDLFPYFVANEAGNNLLNEYVLSPVVPGPATPQASVFRVVVRWTAAEQGAQFSGMLYNEAFGGSGLGSVISLPRARSDSQALRTAGASNWQHVCNDIAFSGAYGGQYWWPIGCELTEQSVFVHPIGNTQSQRTFTQAMTIAAGDGPLRATGNVNYNYAFFVDELSDPIYPFRGSNLTVEVYEYPAGRNPDPRYSLYLPQHVFQIRGAANTSNYPQAQYWHVFNIVRSDVSQPYHIQAIGPTNDGMIETDLQQILTNLP